MKIPILNRDQGNGPDRRRFQMPKRVLAVKVTDKKGKPLNIRGKKAVPPGNRGLRANPGLVERI